MLAGFIRCPADIEFRASDATVSAGVPQPIMLDECMYTLQDDLNAWRFDACQRVKVKPNQVGAPVAMETAAAKVPKMTGHPGRIS